MFEQSLYNPEPATEPLAEGDLFHKYEIKNWEPSPRLYKIFGFTAVANILAILIVGQTSLLTTKTCDSPLIGRVCQVLDTVYVGSLLFGTEREYVDADYDKTNLGDADITFVDVSGETPPLSYPEGYFQIANPAEFAMLQQQQNDPAFNTGFPPGIPITRPSMSGSLIDTAPTIPKQNKDLIDGDLPTFGGTTSSNPRVKGVKTGRGKPPANTDTPKTGEETVANTDPSKKVDSTTAALDDAKADKFGVFINKRPLTDRAKDTVAKVTANQVKLDAKFKVTISGTLGLGKDGKTVVLKNPKPVPEPGVKNDPAMEKLVQDWILAVGDAGWFGYIEKLDEQKKIKQKKVTITIEQNDADFYAVIRAEQPDENVAKTAASGLNAILSIAAPATDGDEQVFLKAATSTSEGRILILNFHIPKDKVQNMIRNKLAEQIAPKKESGNAIGTMTNNTAVK